MSGFRHGDTLISICSKAEKELILVSPFIKSTVIQNILNVTSDTVLLKCVTRWKPEEIKAGVSDLEVWDLLDTRPNSQMFLKRDLHAKYYRSDSIRMIGSANLTNKGLGWAVNSNFEILADVQGSHKALLNFEELLFEEIVQVDNRMADSMRKAVDALPDNITVISEDFQTMLDIEEYDSPSRRWTPMSRRPELLYDFHKEVHENMTSSGKFTAREDLKHLLIP